MKHPIQPLELDEHGVIRFKLNAIVRFLLDEGPFDLNQLAGKSFSVEDHEQFAQLIGYSLSGFGELSYVKNETYEVAAKIIDSDLTESQARLAHLEEVLDTVRTGLREIVPAVFRIHPDDLEAA